MTLSLQQEELLNGYLNEIYEFDLKGWNKRFIKDLRDRYEEDGSEIFLTPKQWYHVERIWR